MASYEKDGYGFAHPDFVVIDKSQPLVQLSSSQRLRYHTAISEEKTRLSKLETRVREDEASLERRKRERDGLRAEIARREVRVAPIQRTPVEILAEIFRFCMPKERYPFVDHTHIALVASRVCRAWRKIAIGTPELWAKRFSDFTVADHAGVDRALVHMTTWLERSGNCPVSLQIDAAAGWAGLQTVTLTLIPHFRHLQYLAMTVPLEWYAPLYDLPVDAAPMLEGIYLDILGQIFLGSSPLNTLTFFKSSPFLRGAYLLGRFVPLKLHLPWAQLTSIRFKCFNEELEIADILEILHLCVNIENLNIKRHDARGRVPALQPRTISNKPIVASKLKDLNLFGPWNYPALFDRLTAPKLAILKFESPLVPRYPLDELISFLRRSGCRLRDLTTRQLNDEECYRLFSAIPSLTSVLLSSEEGITQMLVDQMTYRPDDGGKLPLLPKLETLFVIGYGFQACSETSFAKMVRSRWFVGSSRVDESSIARLRDVELHLFAHTKLTPQAKAILEDCFEEGLVIELDEETCTK